MYLCDEGNPAENNIWKIAYYLKIKLPYSSDHNVKSRPLFCVLGKVQMSACLEFLICIGELQQFDSTPVIVIFFFFYPLRFVFLEL